jgi:hypothetical protein
VHWFAIVGSILLTVIIVWIIVSTVIGHRRQIRAALAGKLDGHTISSDIRALFDRYMPGADLMCLTADEDGMTVEYYLPEMGYRTLRFQAYHAGGTVSFDFTRTGRENFLPDYATGTEVTSINDALSPEDDPTCLCSLGVNAITFAHDELCPCHPLYEGKVLNAALHVFVETGEEGEALTNTTPPNIGGEDHPPYQGPSYGADRLHDNVLPPEVPYDVLGETVPGAAVRIVEKDADDA